MFVSNILMLVFFFVRYTFLVFLHKMLMNRTTSKELGLHYFININTFELVSLLLMMQTVYGDFTCVLLLLETELLMSSSPFAIFPLDALTSLQTSYKDFCLDGFCISHANCLIRGILYIFQTQKIIIIIM